MLVRDDVSYVNVKEAIFTREGAAAAVAATTR
jgi:hypothetical protein